MLTGLITRSAALLQMVCFSAAVAVFSSACLAEESISVRLEAAAKLVDEGNYNLAIVNYLDPIISEFELKYPVTRFKIYGARSQSEPLLYLLESAADKDSGRQENSASTENKDGITAIVLNTDWGDSYYLKGFALVAMQHYPQAQEVLAKAVALSPQNSYYLAEYAYAHIANGQFSQGLEWALKAESASAFSPEAVKREEKGRALRHAGYALIELGRLDEAEKKYKACLKLDKNDEKAKNELNYIKQLRAKKS